MKKSTVLLLSVVFLASILIVGFFGMKSLSYREVIYIDKIVPTSVQLSTDEKCSIKQDENGKYYIRVNYVEDMVITLNYSITPENNTFNNKTNISITKCSVNNPNAVEREFGAAFRVHQKCTFTIRVSAADRTGGAYFDLEVYLK